MAYSFFQKSISVSLLFLLAALLFLSCSKAGFQELKRVRFLALGDSYTIGQSVRSAYCWPNLLADRLEVDAEIDGLDTRIIAATGWRTDNLMDAIDAA
ncbi:MAG TPA: hypothetical protein ENJ82_08990, partial [Bacteroidetes bacterium]|nr:hypothetical protein [Bacteroidota bacterium]